MRRLFPFPWPSLCATCKRAKTCHDANILNKTANGIALAKLSLNWPYDWPYDLCEDHKSFSLLKAPKHSI